MASTEIGTCRQHEGKCIPRTHVLQTLADPEAAHKVKVRFCQLEKSHMLSYPLSL